MFGHLFLYNLKMLLRTKEVVFWTLLYPIALSTFFFLAFGNLGSAEAFATVPVALVESAEAAEGTPFYTALASVSNLGGGEEGDLFDVTVAGDAEAAELLDTGKVAGIVRWEGGKPGLTVSGKGFDQTIIKAFLDSYGRYSSTIGRIVRENPAALSGGLLDGLGEGGGWIEENNGGNPDTTVIYFYTLLAMTCLFSATVGINEVTKVQANMSPLAARVNLSPVRKFKAFLYSLSAAALFEFVVTMIVLTYVTLAFGVDFGGRTGHVILTCAVGCVTGLFFGTFVSSLIKRGEGIKYGVVISVTMFCCFLAGMMQAVVKYFVQENLPFLAYVNPVNLITDAFYALYYYTGFERYALNIALLCAMAAVFCVSTCLVLRRRKYASI